MRLAATAFPKTTAKSSIYSESDKAMFLIRLKTEI